MYAKFLIMALGTKVENSENSGTNVNENNGIQEEKTLSEFCNIVC